MGPYEVSRLREVETRSISAENPDGSRAGGARATTGTGADAARDLGIGWKISPSVNIEAGAERELAAISGSGVITHIWLTTPRDHWRTLILRAWWDESDEPAIEVPLGDFFCQGWGRFAQVSSAVIAVNPSGGFNSYWPMPFADSARISIENRADRTAMVYYQITYELGADTRRAGLPACSVPAEQPGAPRGRRIRSSTGSTAVDTMWAPISRGGSTPRVVG